MLHQVICQPALISKISITLICFYNDISFAINLPFLNRLVTLNGQYLFFVPQETGNVEISK